MDSPQAPRTIYNSVQRNPMPGEAATQVPEPQMLSQFGHCLVSLRDLRCRLEDINSRLRGAQPKDGAQGNSPQKIPHLAMVLADFQNLLEQCHAEATEAQAHLS